MPQLWLFQYMAADLAVSSTRSPLDWYAWSCWVHTVGSSDLWAGLTLQGTLLCCVDGCWLQLYSVLQKSIFSLGMNVLCFSEALLRWYRLIFSKGNALCLWGVMMSCTPRWCHVRLSKCYMQKKTFVVLLVIYVLWFARVTELWIHCGVFLCNFSPASHSSVSTLEKLLRTHSFKFSLASIYKQV